MTTALLTPERASAALEAFKTRPLAVACSECQAQPGERCVRRGKPMGSVDLPAWHSIRLKTVSRLRKAAQEPHP